MMRLLRFIGALLILLLIAAFAAPYFISSEIFKAPLIAKVKEITGQDMTIAGEFKIKLFPSVSLTMGDVVLKEKTGENYTPQVALKSLNVQVALFPLLHKNVVVEGAKITGGTVTYNHDGKRWKASDINVQGSLAGMNSTLDMNGNITWNGIPVGFETEIKTPRSFLDHKKTNVSARIKTDKIKTNIETVAQCTESDCHLADVVLALNDLKAKGDMKVNFGGALPVIDATLSTDNLDLTPFLPPQKHAANGYFISDALAAEGWSKDPIDLSFLRSFNGTFNIDAGAISIYDIKIGKTKLTAKIQGGVAAVDIPSMELYGGKGTLTGTINATGSELVVTRDVLMNGVQINPLLKDAIDSDGFSGTANLQSSVSAHGKSLYDLVSTAQGSGSIRIADGAIKGLNIADMIRNIQSAFRPVDTSARKTDFSELSGTFTISQGIMTNNDLSMKAPLMRLSGNGKINLPQQTLSYHLVPQIVQTAQGQGGKEKQGISIPIIIEGPWDNLMPRPDLESVVKQAIENPQVLKDQIKAGKGAVKDVVKDFKGLLKGLKKQP